MVRILLRSVFNSAPSPRLTAVLFVYSAFTGLVYPSYRAYRALKYSHGPNAELELLTMLVVCVAFIALCAAVLDPLFGAWLPMYHPAKLALTVWLVAPQTRGANVFSPHASNLSCASCRTSCGGEEVPRGNSDDGRRCWYSPECHSKAEVYGGSIQAIALIGSRTVYDKYYDQICFAFFFDIRRHLRYTWIEQVHRRWSEPLKGLPQVVVFN